MTDKTNSYLMPEESPCRISNEISRSSETGFCETSFFPEGTHQISSELGKVLSAKRTWRRPN